MNDPAVSISDFKRWMNSFMQPAVKDNGPYTEEVVEIEPGKFCYARMDKDGNPTAFYGERSRKAMMDYAEKCRSDFSHATEQNDAFDRDYPPQPFRKHPIFR